MIYKNISGLYRGKHISGFGYAGILWSKPSPVPGGLPLIQTIEQEFNNHYTSTTKLYPGSFNILLECDLRIDATNYDVLLPPPLYNRCEYVFLKFCTVVISGQIIDAVIVQPSGRSHQAHLGDRLIEIMTKDISTLAPAARAGVQVEILD